MTQKSSLKRNSFRCALKRSIPILIGYFPVGFAYGILMQQAGYSFLWSGLISATVYTGALQMLMISFLSSGVPLLTAALTAVLLNSRHIFYGLTFLEKFRSYGGWKYLLIYGMSDESYSLLCSYTPQEGADEKWVHIYSTVLIWLYWLIFSMLGGLIGQLIPFDLTGIDFALTALFIVTFLDNLRASPSVLPGAAAIASSLIWIAVVGADRFLLPSLLTTSALLVLFRARIDAPASGKGVGDR